MTVGGDDGTLGGLVGGLAGGAGGAAKLGTHSAAATLGTKALAATCVIRACRGLRRRSGALCVRLMPRRRRGARRRQVSLGRVLDLCSGRRRGDRVSNETARGRRGSAFGCNLNPFYLTLCRADKGFAVAASDMAATTTGATALWSIFAPASLRTSWFELISQPGDIKR